MKILQIYINMRLTQCIKIFSDPITGSENKGNYHYNSVFDINCFGSQPSGQTVLNICYLLLAMMGVIHSLRSRS